MSGGKDGQTLFHRIILATARGLMNKTAVNWHLKFKDIEHNVGLTKNCCIKVSMQKISSIHKLIQQIIRSHELNGHAHLVITSTQKSLKLLLAFLNLHQHAKISSFHQFILEIQSILESFNQAGHTHSWTCPPPNFFNNFWFMWICINM